MVTKEFIADRFAYLQQKYPLGSGAKLRWGLFHGRGAQTSIFGKDKDILLCRKILNMDEDRATLLIVHEYAHAYQWTNLLGTRKAKLKCYLTRNGHDDQWREVERMMLTDFCLQAVFKERQVYEHILVTPSGLLGNLFASLRERMFFNYINGLVLVGVAEVIVAVLLRQPAWVAFGMWLMVPTVIYTIFENLASVAGQFQFKRTKTKS